MKASELKEKSVEELKALLLELREQQFRLRMKKAAGQIKTTHEFSALRKDIARVKTAMNQERGV